MPVRHSIFCFGAGQTVTPFQVLNAFTLSGHVCGALAHYTNPTVPPSSPDIVFNSGT